MACQKLCQNNVPGWGSLEDVFLHSYIILPWFIGLISQNSYSISKTTHVPGGSICFFCARRIAAKSASSSGERWTGGTSVEPRFSEWRRLKMKWFDLLGKLENGECLPQIAEESWEHWGFNQQFWEYIEYKYLRWCAGNYLSQLLEYYLIYIRIS